MRAQLYLYKELREKFQKPISLYAETYYKRIAKVFSNIEEEADEISRKHYEDLGMHFNPECHDESDFADIALQVGIEQYQGMALMKYNTRLMWISTLYQFWEQQVRKFIYEEVNITHQYQDKKGAKLPFGKFCSRGIDEIKDEFSDFGQDVENFLCWGKICELRLLANVIKHGEGWSCTELKQIRPDFFISKHTDINLMDLYNNTLNDIVLNIDDNEFEKYCDAIIQFWDELPERMYSKEC